MVELVAKSPCAGMLPLQVGTVKACEVDLGIMTCLMPFGGQGAALSKALKSAHGMAMPGAMRTTGKESARAIWFGKDQVLLLGFEPDAALSQWGAVSDQSDAWACLEITGGGAEAVLQRLVPLDLRAEQFRVGHTARTLIQHMNGSITRLGAERFLVMVFRSMAASLVHDLKGAMETVAARS